MNQFTNLRWAQESYARLQLTKYFHRADAFETRAFILKRKILLLCTNKTKFQRQVNFKRILKVTNINMFRTMSTNLYCLHACIFIHFYAGSASFLWFSLGVLEGFVMQYSIFCSTTTNNLSQAWQSLMVCCCGIESRWIFCVSGAIEMQKQKSGNRQNVVLFIAAG